MSQTLNEYEVADLDDFRAVVARLKREYSEASLYFRGQTHDFYPTPSADRRDPDEEVERLRPYVGAIWESLVERLVDQLTVSPDDRLMTGMALLQHYGFRSWFIDVTSDPVVALWFARWRYSATTHLASNAEHDESHPGPAPLHHAVTPFQLAHHDSFDEPGVVWVFAVPPGFPQLLELTAFMPEAAARVHRQEGAGLLPDADGTFSTTLAAKIRVATPPQQAAAPEPGRRLSTSYLFPGPRHDEVYRALLRVPRPVLSVEHYMSQALDVLDLPVYLEPESPDFWWFVKNLRIIIGYYSDEIHQLESGESCNIVQLPFTRHGGPRARFTPTFPWVDEEGPVDSTPPLTEESLRHWPTLPLLLQVPVLRELPSIMFNETPYPLTRGYLVELSPGVLRARLLFETLEGLSLTRPVDLTLPWRPSVPADDASWEEETTFVIGTWLRHYTLSLESSQAFLTTTSERHFGYYWHHPEGVVPVGDTWQPSQQGDGA